MAKNHFTTLVNNGRKLFDSDTLRTIGQILFGVAIFAALYLFLITGFALGMTM